MRRSILSLVIILFFVVTTASCMPIFTSPEPPNEPPIVYIDSISATTVTKGQTVTFTGHGTDVGGSIVAYSWRSELDGVLSTSASFSTSSLSVGTHYIYFKVQDNRGDWSKELYRIVNVRQAGTVKPSVNSLKFTPDRIFAGEASTLTWDVVEATTVSILPDIGNVPPVGSRLIYPQSGTTYTLTATNQAGVVTQNVRIFVSPKPDKVVELFSIEEEEGSVDSNGVLGSYPKAGITTSPMSMQAFFSFDISMIPSSATIKSASIDLTNYFTHGNPLGFLGAMAVFDDQYGVLESRDYAGIFTLDALIYTYTPPIDLLTSSQLASAVQKQVAASSSRFQVRVQFQKFFFDPFADPAKKANYLEFVKGKTRLIVSYE